MRNENFLSSTRARFWIALALSVLLHSVLGGGLALSPPMNFAKKANKTEVELLSPEEMKAMMAAAVEAAKARQIVETDKQRVNDEIDEKAKYLSEFDQKVLKETRAAQTGQFTNEAGQGKKQAAVEKAPEAASKDVADEKATQEKSAQTDADDSELQAFENGDIAVAARKDLKNFTPNFRKLPTTPSPAEQQAAGDGADVSKTDDHLKNVPTGMQTMLSTREFMYYSYYNRIKDKLRQYWEPKIREKFERTIRQGRSIASDGDKITKVVIILDEKGTLIRVQVLSASGLVDLDEAAVEAFRAAAPFPNPPKGIVEEDGTIKIRWDFVLEA